ncbi:hypothetical protein ILUMI_19494 [Ignelater luminosus]|uniref:RNA-directed DNA polymerase n=1 Tax=Ignelater luminosus TaxID=2038154 RepID=A0A8K0FZV6_IGNLU|nr:hypothetical protein ILUMI_19494 [Ignelater luminosus]
MWSWYLQVIHEGHMGINKCLSRAKERVWWPGLRRQLINLIESCETCLKNKQPSVEPMIPSKLPTRPWEIIGADLATHNNNTYLVIQDYDSKYSEIRKLQNTTSQAIVEYCKDVKSHHEMPTELKSDNGKQFESQEFRRCAKEYEFKWTSSSLEYQQANGLAESAVKLVKRILHMNEDPFGLS